MSNQIEDIIRTDVIVQSRSEKDRYDNDVTIISFPDGRNYRMVHHSVPSWSKQRFTIYAGRGKFLKGESKWYDQDTYANWIKVGGVYTSWGDGDNLGVDLTDKWVNETIFKAERAEGRAFRDEDFTEFVVSVLLHAAERDDLWDYKDVPVKTT